MSLTATIDTRYLRNYKRGITPHADTSRQAMSLASLALPRHSKTAAAAMTDCQQDKNSTITCGAITRQEPVRQFGGQNTRKFLEDQAFAQVRPGAKTQFGSRQFVGRQ